MRKPFVTQGFVVTEDNMEAIARWCKGNVVRENVPAPFVRVPVSRPTTEKQTRAYVGTYVVVSVFGNVKSYKVYKKEWLDESFITLTDEAVALLKAFGRAADGSWDGDEGDDEIDFEVENPTCCHRGNHAVPSSPIPTQSSSKTGPKPGPRPTFQAPSMTRNR